MKLKEKIKNSWKKFKEFYMKKYEKNKILTIILTIILAMIIIPILLFLLFVIGIIVFGLAVLVIVFWIIYKITFGSNKSSYSSDKVKKSSGISHRGYSEEDVLAMIDTYPNLDMNRADWYTLAEALEESKYTKKIKVMYSGKLPIFIFPKDQKPRMNFRFFSDNTIESGGGLFEKAKEHFTTKELNSGKICIVYDEKRLTSKDM